MARGDPLVMPSSILIIFDDRHVIREHPPETRIGEQAGALVDRHRLRAGLERDRLGIFFFFEHVADHQSPFGLKRLMQALCLGKRSALRFFGELRTAPGCSVDRRSDERVENTLSVE